MHRFSTIALGSIRDLLPIVLVILFFQLFVLDRPVGELAALIDGVIAVVLGLTLFTYGLELALFPIGETLAHALARRGSVVWLVVFAFLLGFGSTIAEPAVTAVAGEAAETTAAAGFIANNDDAKFLFALGLRISIALAVGSAIVLGVLRIIAGWSLVKLIISGYALVVGITFFAPAEIIGIAYDSGGVTTSTVTVPLVAALGVGLASSIGERNPMTDGFGLIAFASLTPMIFVMGYGVVIAWI